MRIEAGVENKVDVIKSLGKVVLDDGRDFLTFPRQFLGVVFMWADEYCDEESATGRWTSFSLT